MIVPYCFCFQIQKKEAVPPPFRRASIKGLLGDMVAPLKMGVGDLKKEEWIYSIKKRRRIFMKVVIWGVGVRGKRLIGLLEPGMVVAFIDNDQDKVGTQYMNCPIISLEEYIQNYSEYFILISLRRPEDIILQLEDRGIQSYFDTLNCPYEIFALKGHADLDAYLDSLNQGKSYGIYGTNFYSIYVYDRMRRKGIGNLFLIPEIGTEQSKEELIEKAFDFIRSVSIEDCGNCVDKVFVATGRNKGVQALREKMGQDACIEDIFDLSRKISDYRNDGLKRFRNIHEGKRCFIVATGPSLTMDDLDILHKNGEYTIGMNRVYLAFEKTQWRPEYYMVTDWRCIKENGEEIKILPIKHKFIADSYMEFWEGHIPEGIYRFHAHEINISGEKVPFSDELIYGVYARGTVTYACIQLAVYLGFREIYLLGVDFDFSVNYKDRANHFIKTYYSENSEVAFFADKESLEAYMSAKEYADAHGIKIYNATRGGKLEVFERVDFDILFE